LHLTTFRSTMTGDANQAYNIASDVTASSSQSVAGAEGKAASSTSSSTIANQAIANKEVPLLYQYWKASTVTDNDICAYHTAGWLPGVFLCTLTTLDFPTINQTNIVCFESHLICGLGLSPSKFLVSILNYVGCELVYLYPNIVSALSWFSMLCEC
jgi:hypothetical protein